MGNGDSKVENNVGEQSFGHRAEAVRRAVGQLREHVIGLPSSMRQFDRDDRDEGS